MLRCERTTPLGSAVDPDVKITVAVASRLSPFRPGTKPGKRRDRHELGDGGGPEFVGQSHLLGDVFEQDELALGSDLESIEHLG